MSLLRSLAEALHLGEDLVGGLGPHERLADLIVYFDVLDDCLPELWHRSMRSALKRLLCKQAEEALHEVEPGRVRRREMKDEARMAQQDRKSTRLNSSHT